MQMLVFFSTWCSDCKDEILKLNKENMANKKYLLINTFDSLGRGEESLRKMGVNIPCFYDSDNSISEKYHVSFVPYTVNQGQL